MRCADIIMLTAHHFPWQTTITSSWAQWFYPAVSQCRYTDLIFKTFWRWHRLWHGEAFSPGVMKMQWTCSSYDIHGSLIILLRSISLQVTALRFVCCSCFFRFFPHHAALVIQASVAAPMPAPADQAAASTAPTGLGLGWPGVKSSFWKQTKQTWYMI